MTDPDPYHTLSATDRDHLLAAAWYATDYDTLPAGADVGRAVGTLTEGDPAKGPNPNTTSRSLGRLADAGLVERVADEPAGAAQGVRVTDEGYRALARGAARLDAAATVEANL